MTDQDSRTQITLPTGDTAYVELSDGDKTTIASPLPSPPGSTVKGTISGVQAEFQLKVRNCKKKGDFFFIDGRTMNATREMRAALKVDG